MAPELGGSQISQLLETVPGIASVLRSPVADALVNMIRAGADVVPFDYADAEELVQYAVRRGLINADEGDQVLADVSKSGRRRAAAAKAGPRGKKGPPKRKPSGVKKSPARPKKPVKKSSSGKRPR